MRHIAVTVVVVAAAVILVLIFVIVVVVVVPFAGRFLILGTLLFLLLGGRVFLDQRFFEWRLC